jgi:molybdopterin-dependent oxidoreductase alpha subunit
MYRALSSKNACKTCALGMGGQAGGMVNEEGMFPEVCKKSVQAMGADMQGRIRDGFFEEFSFDRLERFTPRELEHAGRITTPLYAAPGDRSYRAITWDEALARVCNAMKAAAPDENFFYLSGRSSNEAGYLLQLLARLYGTNNVNNCSFFCHQASGVGLWTAIGTGTATVNLEDVGACDFLMLLGGNPASNHPRFMRSLMDLKRRAGTIVVVNPLREVGLVKFKVPSDPLSLIAGTKIADFYVQPHIGGDIGVVCGIAKHLLERGRVDEQWVGEHTEGFGAWRELVGALTWEMIERDAGVTRAELGEVAEAYARADRAIFAWTMGITHHEHGVENVQAITNLALMRGMLGKLGAGLLPLRGHSNVQGIGSMGAVPALKDSVRAAIERRLNVTLPTTPGLDTLACVERAHAGGVRVAWHLGGNLFGSCPDAAFARDSLRRIGLTVFMSTTLNTGHVHGRGQESIVLPVLARDEEPQATTQESMFSFVRLSDGGAPRHRGPRAEVEIVAEVGERLLGAPRGVDFAALRSHGAVRELIGATIPGYATIAEMDRTAQEFHIDGRLLREARFPTPSGRARFHAVAPTPGPGSGGELRLMTIRSEGQFNTVVYEEEDLYRGQERRDVILMSPVDIAGLGLRENDAVTVRSDAGEMRSVLVRRAAIRAGNAAMYYPEANALVPRRVDERSRTPSFKNVRVRVAKEVGLKIVG